MNSSAQCTTEMVLPVAPDGDAPPRSCPCLSIEGLTVRLGRGAEQRTILDRISLDIRSGERLVMIGESGSGKSMLLKSVLGLLVDTPGIVAGKVSLLDSRGERVELLGDLANFVKGPPEGPFRVGARWRRRHRRRMTSFWGSRIGYVPQQGAQALDPTRTVGALLREAMGRKDGHRLHPKSARERGIKILKRLNFPHPSTDIDLYPSQLSGGMAQRAVIALALSRGARVLFADEPTTGLDPQSQDALLRTLDELWGAGDLESLVLVTHDFSVAEALADRVVVMDGGRIVEDSVPVAFFGSTQPSSSIARQLLSEYRRLSESHRAPLELDLPRLRVRGARKAYRRGAESNLVLKGVDLELQPGEVLGLVGPSGEGKSTLGMAIAGQLGLDEGLVELDGKDIGALKEANPLAFSRRVQVLFQQGNAAIHPRMRVEEALMETATEVMGLKGEEARRRVALVLERVELGHRAKAFPSQLSGGQLRRVGLARLALVEPEVLVADEPTAGVDASLRAGILELLLSLTQGPSRTSLLLISHDRHVIGHAANRVLTLRDGRPASAELKLGSPPCQTQQETNP